MKTLYDFIKLKEFFDRSALVVPKEMVIELTPENLVHIFNSSGIDFIPNTEIGATGDILGIRFRVV